MVNEDYLRFFIEIWAKENKLEGSLYDIFPRFRSWKVIMDGDRSESFVALFIKTRMGGELEREYLEKQAHLFTCEFVDLHYDRGDSTYLSLVYDISEYVPDIIRGQLWNERYVK